MKIGGNIMIKEKMEKFMRFILAIAVFISNFGYNPVVLAGNDEVDAEYTHGQIIDPVNSIGSADNAGDVKLTKTISKTDEDGVYNVTINVQGKHKEETQVMTVPIYTVVVLDTSGSMRPCIREGLFICWEYNEEKYDSAKEGAKQFADTLLEKYSQAQLALVTFSTSSNIKRNFASENFDGISFPNADGGTNLAEAIKTGSNMLLSEKEKNKNAKLYMVILSDGYPEYYSYQPDNHFEEAKKAKDNGIEIFTIGYETTVDTEELLSNIATNNSHFVKADSSNIVESFSDIASEIKVEIPAGSDATVTDVVADGFSYVANSANVEVGVEGKNVSFDIGDITDEGKTVTFQIEVNKDMPTGLHRTNDFAKAVYTDVDGNEQTVELDDSSKIYWEQLKYNYIVNYREQGTDTDLINSKEVKDAVYGQTYQEEAATIKGYNLVEGTENPADITIEEDNQEFTFYYTKKTDLSYTVRYLEEGTEEVLAKEKVVPNQTFLDSYTETAKTITGYNVVGEATKTGTIDSEELVVTFYYTLRNDLSYRVEYYFDDVINDEMTKYYENIEFGTVIKDYDKIDVDGYEFVKDSGSIVVDVDTDNVIKVYYESVEIEAPQTGIDLSNDNNYLQMLALILLSSVGIIGSSLFGF